MYVKIGKYVTFMKTWFFRNIFSHAHMIYLAEFQVIVQLIWSIIFCMYKLNKNEYVYIYKYETKLKCRIKLSSSKKSF